MGGQFQKEQLPAAGMVPIIRPVWRTLLLGGNLSHVDSREHARGARRSRLQSWLYSCPVAPLTIAGQTGTIPSNRLDGISDPG